ncbi:polar flagellar hook-length control protein FliK [Aeromonas encheleia]|uniref:flagellar hook-length control protein FliK n=1 Tax=Aeromonas encheleia TaxID=73010 RepID=UPI000694C387|nr:flagellar hook-length control protein FliK [Aeromonas encheleia]VEG95692.1 polar flagellar hook-length control protein FliK [Aeromonas encheleia]
MIQTQLIKATATQTTPADARLPLGTGEGAGLPSLDEAKAAFADAMAKAQRTEISPSASQGGDGESLLPEVDAKSLASSLDESQAGHDKPVKGEAAEAELPPADFLQQLQASLRQDAGLSTPPVVASGQTEPSVEPSVQGSLSVEASAQSNLPVAPSVEASAQGTLPVAPSAQTSLPVVASAPAVPAPTDGNSLPPESQSASRLEAGKPAGVNALPATAQPSEVLIGGTLNAEAGEGADAISDVISTAGTARVAGLPEEDTPATDPQHTDKGDKPALEEVAEQPPLSARERAALLAKVLPQAPQVATEPVPEGGEPTPVGKAEQPASPEPAAKVAHTAQTAHSGPSAQGSAARAFGEGQIRMDIATGTEPTASAEDGAKPAPGAEAQELKPAQAAKADAGAAVASNAAPQLATPATEPVLTAPQQILASHEPQGPQASLASLSAGIQQMEAEPAVAVKVAAELKQPDMKQKPGELGKHGGLEVGATEQSEASPSAQSAQQASQIAEHRPAAEVAARRDAQSLPHLRLATPEAPAQLHQKVNLMLADKLQQAEIQLDPLGLGKMKIQIQIDASNQANVHFVVQHGQTREMLEQAMPRLRDMLAGQGIQLGQTLVQQQPQQQQSQGQSPFSGQGQQGQSGGGTLGGREPAEGEVTTRTMSLLVESANEAGIDFYA